MIEKYKVAKGKKIIVSIYDAKNRETVEYTFDENDKVSFELVENDLWLIDSDGTSYLTDDYPIFHIKNGELEKI